MIQDDYDHKVMWCTRFERRLARYPVGRTQLAEFSAHKFNVTQKDIVVGETEKISLEIRESGQ